MGGGRVITDLECRTTGKMGHTPCAGREILFGISWSCEGPHWRVTFLKYLSSHLLWLNASAQTLMQTQLPTAYFMTGNAKLIECVAFTNFVFTDEETEAHGP